MGNRWALLWLLLAGMLSGCMPSAAGAVAAAADARLAPAGLTTPAASAGANVADLWLDVSMGPPLVDWFNAVARPDDIARVEHPSQVGVLAPVTTGRRLVVFKSLRDVRRALEVMGNEFDIIGYNLESGPATPPEEQADPVAAIRAMRELAKSEGKLLAIGPDRNFALTYGAQIAPYVDIFVIQVQRIQTEPDLVREYVLPLATELRRANPNIQISVQVRTEGDVVALVDMVETLAPELDGLSVLTSPETTAVAEALVQEIRSRAPTATPVTAEAMPTAIMSATPSDSVPAISTPVPTLAPPTTTAPLTPTNTALPRATRPPPEAASAAPRLMPFALGALGVGCGASILLAVLAFTFGHRA
jgi:hypothetical protein